MWNFCPVVCDSPVRNRHVLMHLISKGGNPKFSQEPKEPEEKGRISDGSHRRAASGEHLQQLAQKPPPRPLPGHAGNSGNLTGTGIYASDLFSQWNGSEQQDNFPQSEENGENPALGSYTHAKPLQYFSELTFIPFLDLYWALLESESAVITYRLSGLYGNALGFVPGFDCFSVQNGLPFLPLAWVCVSKL
ncbi:hypothetical protein llap_6784 [Limosa lapponica baueri]|uniref:Uncharacterized protein n=1 Tax=Limosa lapponica baueri TaxID=1758121 RepID=A0A2I0UA22_LIMLA|nr:hypothetical protein llap_6784 [Limosa lapponica baueri]